MPRVRVAWRRAAAAALALVLPLVFCAGALAEPAVVDVNPTPLSVEATPSARPVVIGDGTEVLVPPDDPAALAAARTLTGLALKTRGLRLRVVVGRHATAPGTSIELLRQPDDAEGAEGYRLVVAANGRVTISATTRAGLFYGAASLWQLMTPDARHGPVTAPAVTILDRPRFPWRGLLLDSARHYQSPAFVEQLIDWMALHKLNVLQWHLTDDQGWRLQILKYPKLTEVGAWRETPGDGRYGGFYTQADVRRIVAYAAARNVTIVPEIEMPGHTLAAILAYPELASQPGAAASLRGDWGVFPYLYAPSERTFGFLQDVLTEVMALFPGLYIDIGGDEAVKDQWRASPAIQAQIKALGLANEDALQGWFNGRIAGFLAAHGRRMIGWDDILAGGGLPADAAVESWHLDGALTAARQGHDAVIATDPILYFDHRQSDLPEEPPGRGIVVSLADVYGYEPAPATLTPDERDHFMGVQANLWTEHIRTEARLQKMAFPRAAAVAELGWTEPERKNWPAFVQRLPAELARYRPLGLEADTSALEVKADQQVDPATGALRVSLSTQAGLGQIRFTTGGSAPSATSAIYQAPLTIAATTRLRAAAFEDGRALAAPIDQLIGPTGPDRRTSQELTLCTNKLALNLESPTETDGARPVYLIDIMNPCWIYPQAELSGIGALTVSVAPLPFNFQLGADVTKIVLRPPTTDQGELEVRLDGCAGPLLASAPLERASLTSGPSALAIAIPPVAGRHVLCLSFTAKRLEPMWAVGWVQLKAGVLALAPNTGATP